MLAKRQIEERQAALENALASQRLEGLEPDAETIADLERQARGELTIAEVLARLRDRGAAWRTTGLMTPTLTPRAAF